MPQQEPVTPSRPAWNLIVPILSPISRRSSPRAEDVLRRPRKAEGTRKRLKQYQTFDDAVSLLQSSKNIVVLTGAGISTSVGIPDFRSDQGLYSQLSKLGITQAEEFFSKQFFVDEPQTFFKYVKRVVPGAIPMQDGTYRNVDPVKAASSNTTYVPKFTPTHAFLAMLQAKGILLTNYTQNIDGLERAAGVSVDQFVQCHGSWDTATCLTCQKSSSGKKYLPVVLSGNVPYCKCSLEPVPQKPQSRKRAKSRPGQKRKRAQSFSDHSSDDNTGPQEPPRGLLKPDITFFEERITDVYHSRLESDRPKIDLLIIIGTSLKVDPVKKMLFEVSPDVPQIYLSKERFSGALCSLPGVQVDIELLGECDLVIEELCRRAGWTEDLQKWLWEQGQAKIKGFESFSTQLDHNGASKEPSRSPLKKIKSEANIATLRAENGRSTSRASTRRERTSTPDGARHIQPRRRDVSPMKPTSTSSKILSRPVTPQPTDKKSVTSTTPTITRTEIKDEDTTHLTTSSVLRQNTSFTSLFTSIDISSPASTNEKYQPSPSGPTAVPLTNETSPDTATDSTAALQSRDRSGTKTETLVHSAPTATRTQTTAKDATPGVPPSKVKVEIVEGTTHQWRITRKK